MKTTLIKIGNSRGVRIPKSFIDEADLGTDIDISLKKDKIVITRIKKTPNEEAILTEKALADWSRNEEDDAWTDL